MKKILAILKNKGGLFVMMNMMAFMVVANSLSTRCYACHHQPKVPDSVKKLSKFQ